jgi:hypothetical protein
MDAMAAWGKEKSVRGVREEEEEVPSYSRGGACEREEEEVGYRFLFRCVQVPKRWTTRRRVTVRLTHKRNWHLKRCFEFHCKEKCTNDTWKKNFIWQEDDTWKFHLKNAHKFHFKEKCRNDTWKEDARKFHLKNAHKFHFKEKWINDTWKEKC